ncbi:MAG: GTP 3',8-cyclase MoaA [Opitutaceae bacterium]|nr:GTP 3',8-cyclase MoaA [Opitutaceae bacterium]
MPSTLDALRRPLRDLRVSVTDQCNFRCPYCMPAEVFGPGYRFLPRAALMSQQELQAILAAFVAMGVEKLRFTGGEPLLRPDLPDLVAYAKKTLQVSDVAVTTNGWLLERSVDALAAAGLDRLNVSLDGLDKEAFREMTGRDLDPERVLSGIRAAQARGLPVKVNMVVQRGTNDHQIEPMAEWARAGGVTLRFIEFMDVGNHNGWSPERVVPAAEIVKRLAARWPVRAIGRSYRGEVAARYAYLDGKGEIGLVSSITEPFCRDCNRARLSADGKLFTCLFATSGHDLLGFLRSTRDPRELVRFVTDIWQGRRDRYSEERELLRATGSRESKIEMSYIGG